jgi:hypothetical protein
MGFRQLTTMQLDTRSVAKAHMLNTYKLLNCYMVKGALKLLIVITMLEYTILNNN